MSHSCKCNGNHHEKEEEKGEKLEKILYIISVIIFAITFIPQIPENIKIGMYIVSIILAGYEILFEGIKNIFKLNFEEDTLMAIAVVAACVIGEFTEGALVILLFKLGEFIEHHAVEKSNDSIKQIVIGGVRCPDHYLRLLLAGVPKEKIKFTRNEEDTVDLLDLNGIDKVFITYDVYTIHIENKVKARLENRLKEEEK